jgi:hypothetical protein
MKDIGHFLEILFKSIEMVAWDLLILKGFVWVLVDFCGFHILTAQGLSLDMKYHICLHESYRYKLKYDETKIHGRRGRIEVGYLFDRDRFDRDHYLAYRT